MSQLEAAEIVGMSERSFRRWTRRRAPLDLVITLDDATSAVSSAIPVEQEGTESSFPGLAETMAAHGLPCSFHTDGGSHPFLTARAREPVDRSRLAQVGRALGQLGIEHIPAYSKARGRCERAFRTLQDRLPKELALAGVATVEAANAFIRERLSYAGNWVTTVE